MDTSPLLSMCCCMQWPIKPYEKALCKYEVLLRCRVTHWTSLFSIRHIPWDSFFLPEHAHSTKSPSGDSASAKSSKANCSKVNNWELVCKGGQRHGSVPGWRLKDAPECAMNMVFSQGEWNEGKCLATWATFCLPFKNIAPDYRSCNFVLISWVVWSYLISGLLP